MRASELILTADGAVYHLRLHPGEVAPKILLVGDPGRVEKVASRFSHREFTRAQREFYTITGTYEGQRMTVISTGIGPDNIDITLSELDALFNIDFDRRQAVSQPQSLKLLRLGTCGGMQPEIPIGSLIHSRYAIGGDGVMAYYRLPAQPAVAPLAAAWAAHPPTASLDIPHYFAAADSSLDRLIATDFPHIRGGITFTAAGFYGPQGRDLGRLPIAYPDLPQRLAGLRLPDGSQVLNMEMESAAILALGAALGHQAGTLATVLANRQAGAFAPDPGLLVEALIDTGLALMHAWA